MPTRPASAEALRDLLGQPDDLVIKRILESGASVDEVKEAVCIVEDEHGWGEQRHAASPRVAAVCAVLEGLFAEDEDERTLPVAD